MILITQAEPAPQRHGPTIAPSSCLPPGLGSKQGPNLAHVLDSSLHVRKVRYLRACSTCKHPASTFSSRNLEFLPTELRCMSLHAVSLRQPVGAPECCTMHCSHPKNGGDWIIDPESSCTALRVTGSRQAKLRRTRQSQLLGTGAELLRWIGIRLRITIRIRIKM